jgi:ABC-type transport system involved in multi-copper enzyme maturation permease subunit
MLSYFGGEVYRLFHKRSMYIYFGVLALGYLLLTFFRAHTFGYGSVLTDAENLYLYLPPLVGGFLFAAVFTDDLNSKNITTLVGFGLSKAAIVVAKFLLVLLFSAICYALVMLLTWLIHAAFGWPASADMMVVVGKYAFKQLLTTVVFAAIASIFVYGFLRTTFALVFYLLFVLSVFGALLARLFSLDFFMKIIPNLANYLPDSLIDQLSEGMIAGSFPIGPSIGCALYIVVSIVIAIIIFSRRELEF